MTTHRSTLHLTGREADALNTLLSIVLNDPDDSIVSDRDRRPLGQVLDQLQTAIREAHPCRHYVGLGEACQRCGQPERGHP